MLNIKDGDSMLENLINKAEEKINEALQHANNVENGIKNKTTEILNSEYCMGQFMAYMDMIEGIDLDKHVEMGEKTKEIRQKVLEAINKIYG